MVPVNIALGVPTLSSPPRTWIVRETMALALESNLRTVIGEVMRKHGLRYKGLKEEQLSAIDKFVSGHRMSLYTSPLPIPFSYAAPAYRMRTQLVPNLWMTMYKPSLRA